MTIPSFEEFCKGELTPLNENLKTGIRDHFIAEANGCPYCPKGVLQALPGYDEHHIRKTTGKFTTRKLVVLVCETCKGVVFVDSGVEI